MTPRFHPYAPLAAALALSAASLAAAYVGIAPAAPGMAAIRIGGDGRDGVTAVSSPLAAASVAESAATSAAESAAAPPDADAARGAPSAAGRVAYLRVDDAGVWIDFTPQRTLVVPAPAADTGTAQSPQRVAAPLDGVARHETAGDRADGMAS